MRFIVFSFFFFLVDLLQKDRGDTVSRTQTGNNWKKGDDKPTNNIENQNPNQENKTDKYKKKVQALKQKLRLAVKMISVLKEKLQSSEVHSEHRAQLFRYQPGVRSALDEEGIN